MSLIMGDNELVDSSRFAYLVGISPGGTGMKNIFHFV